MIKMPGVLVVLNFKKEKCKKYFKNVTSKDH